jgi:arylsulfatase A-like enzyme
MKRLLYLTIIILFFLGCKMQEKEVKELPNFVWLLSEDNSKHYMKLFDENGIETPQIKKLVEHGLIFTRAFSNAPVCSTARTTLISGSYGPRIGTQYHRKSKPVPMPDEINMFPAYLREIGYYTTNNHKEDYNAIKTEEVWDESSNKAHWRNREPEQPFFHKQTVGNSHESQLHFDMEFVNNHTLTTNPESVFVAPVHPNTALFRFTNAYYHDKMLTVDEGVAKVVEQLEEDGLLENTFIFYFGDHGGVLPGSKGYLYETGLHVPLVVRIPEKFRHMIDAEYGSNINGFVSFIDFGPTLLNLAGIKVPEGMDGVPFLGKEISNADMNTHDETYGYADRFDEKYDMVRSVRKGKYKYMRNYQPFNPDGLHNGYRYRMLAYQEWLDLFNEGKLNDVQSRFFMPRQPEELYDVEADPYETINLATDPRYANVVKDLSEKMTQWVKKNNDLSFYPESVLRREAFDNPVVFGKSHREEISRLVDVANLNLMKFEDARGHIESALNSSNPWERYWGLIVCSSFGERALGFVDKAKELSLNDDQLLVRTRAAEFLALYAGVHPGKVITDALRKTRDDIEASLIMNTVVLLMESTHQYNFNINKEMFDPEVLKGEYVNRRLEFILPYQEGLVSRSSGR